MCCVGEMLFHMDDFFLRYYSCLLDKTIQNIFYKIKFSFLCTHHIDVVYFLLIFLPDFYCVRVFWRQMPFYTLLIRLRDTPCAFHIFAQKEI